MGKQTECEFCGRPFNFHHGLSLRTCACVSSKVQDYEAALETHEKLIEELRDGITRLQVENRRLWRENERLKRKLFGPVVFGWHVFGFHMESADVD